MLVVPRKLEDVISVTPAILPNWRSSGVATEEAMISGAAPGRLAATEIVGKSTCGSEDTGSTRNAMAPANAIAMVGGLLLSQVLTLYTTPVIYIFFDNLAKKVSAYRTGGNTSPASVPAD